MDINNLRSGRSGLVRTTDRTNSIYHAIQNKPSHTSFSSPHNRPSLDQDDPFGKEKSGTDQSKIHIRVQQRNHTKHICLRLFSDWPTRIDIRGGQPFVTSGEFTQWEGLYEPSPAHPTFGTLLLLCACSQILSLG